MSTAHQRKKSMRKKMKFQSPATLSRFPGCSYSCLTNHGGRGEEKSAAYTVPHCEDNSS